jgi:hypothetical protein
MPDWPGYGFNRNIITPYDTFDAMCLRANAGASGVVWPLANRALFVPIYVFAPVVAKRLLTFNGQIGNNIDLGIYRDDLSLVVSTGTTAMSGSISTPQAVDITDTPLPAGRYYLALAINGTTGGNYRYGPTVSQSRLFGAFKMDSAFPLPATAVPSVMVDQYLPNMGVEVLRYV